MKQLTLMSGAPGKHHDLCHSQLRNAAGVAKGGIKYGHTRLSRIIMRDLISSNTEAPDGEEILGLR
jgi:hypothetical protein